MSDTLRIDVRARALDPVMQQTWRAVFELSEVLPHKSWTIIGGQLAQLHAWEQGVMPPRSTTDVDAGLDIRDQPRIATTATRALKELGFQSQATTTDGKTVQWMRGNIEVDVLVPAHLGRDVRDIDNSVMLASHGVQQALERSETIRLWIDEKTAGVIRRPSLYGSIIAKAAALANGSDTRQQRHLHDLNFMLGLLTSSHMTNETVRSRDQVHLNRAIRALAEAGYLQDVNDPARGALEGLAGAWVGNV